MTPAVTGIPAAGVVAFQMTTPFATTSLATPDVLSTMYQHSLVFLDGDIISAPLPFCEAMMETPPGFTVTVPDEFCVVRMPSDGSLAAIDDASVVPGAAG